MWNPIAVLFYKTVLYHALYLGEWMKSWDIKFHIMDIWYLSQQNSKLEEFSLNLVFHKPSVEEEKRKLTKPKIIITLFLWQQKRK